MNLPKPSFMIALTLGALIALTAVSRAQETKDAPKTAPPSTGQREGRGGGPGRGPNFQAFAEQLKLSDEQKTKVQPIYQEEMTKMRELRQDTTLTTEARRDKVRELREQYLAKMKPILTTEQYDKLKNMRAQGPGGRAGSRAPRQGGETKPPASSSDTEKK